MQKSSFPDKKGIKMQFITHIMMVINVLCVIMFLIFFIPFHTNYKKLSVTTYDYSESNKAVIEFMYATDFLTDQARLFAVNSDPTFMDNYFNEVDHLHQRENAVSILQMTHDEDVCDVNIKMALNESYYLQSIEMYSMKLICEARHLPNSRINAKLQGIKLSMEDEALSASAKVDLARKILFDTEYLSSKHRIVEYCSKVNRIIAEDFVSAEKTFDSIFLDKYNIVVFIVVFTFIFSLCFTVLVQLNLIVPINQFIKAMSKGEKVRAKGASELYKIASVYNSLCEQNALKASVLQHKAEHDPLTGLINRAAFDEIKDYLRDVNEPVAFLLIDIDLFKQINDVYGHSAGDAVLKKISALLSNQFRGTDYVARVGGDEFAVIMTKFGNSPADIIKRKIDSLNNSLQSLSDGLPSVSLSVGVSFSPEGYVDELVDHADMALYKVKKGGRCNCSFYDYHY